MEDFLKAIWTPEFEVKKDEKKSVSSVFHVQKKQKKEPLPKKEKKQRVIEPGFSCIIDCWEGVYFWKVATDKQKIEEYAKEKGGTVLHIRPVADIVFAGMIAKKKWKKYKIGPGRWHRLPQEFVDLLCTYTH